MNWIQGIQRAVNYIELHMLETIDYEEAAKQAYSSSFHFQRIFSILCGYTLGDYIRMRRLSLAGKDLSSSNIRVIDAAHKYGYDSPESFSRAFSRFHGVTPSEAKHGSAALKSFSQLSVKLTLEGGNTINYRVEKKEAFPLICRKLRASNKTEVTAKELISNFWSESIMDGTIQTLNRYSQEEDIFKNWIVGTSFGQDADEAEFPYAIGAHYNGAPITDPKLAVVEIPAHTYIVFTCTGKMPEAFTSLYQQIYCEFFPTSIYEPCGGTDFESYPSANIEDPGYTCEFWIAVKERNNLYGRNNKT